MQKNRHARLSVQRRAFALFTMAFCLALFCGCAGKSAVKTTFWPPAPDLPRVQYLKAIKDSGDVRETRKLSILNLGGEAEDFVDIIKPYGIAVGGGKLYVCDTVQAEVLVIDLRSKKMNKLAGNVNAGRLKKPINASLDEQGNLYVVDTSRREVLKYAPDGSYQRSYGSGHDMKPVDVQVRENFVYILDQSTSQVRIFDAATGDLLNSVGRRDDALRSLSGPTNMAADDKGAIYVTNFNGRIIKLDRDGNFIFGYGKLGTRFGEFGRPRGIAVDKDGLVYVVDAAAQNVQLFDDQMRLLMFFGAPGTPGSLNIPAGIAVTSDDLAFYQEMAEPGFILEKVIFVVSQVGDHKVTIYGFGKQQGLDYDAEVRKALEEQKRREVEAEEKRRLLQQEKDQKEKAIEGQDGKKEARPEEELQGHGGVAIPGSAPAGVNR